MLSIPLKVEHVNFFGRALIPLHKVKNLSSFNTQLQNCIKIYVEKQTDLGIHLVNGLIKFWPITSPGKEVIYITEIEEVLEMIGNQAENRYSEFGNKLLTQVLKTSQGMHYPAAERALMLLNSDLM